MQVFVTEAVFEKTGGLALMGRARAIGGGYLQQDDAETITLKVFAESDPSAPVNGDDGEDIDPADVIFNALRLTDPDSGETLWTKDGTGFNFLYRVKASQLTRGGEAFRFEFQFSKTGSEDLFGVFKVPTLSLYSV